MEGRRAPPRNYWGQIIDIDHFTSKNFDTKDLRVDDIINFQYMEEYQYRVGSHTMVFKNLPDVIQLKIEEDKVRLEVLLPEKEAVANG